MPYIIRQPTLADRDELHRLYSAAIHHAFEVEHITDDIAPEIQSQVDVLESYFTSRGAVDIVLVARESPDGPILGTMAYGPPSRFHRQYLTLADPGTVAVKAAYILPEWQGRGLGTSLLTIILTELRRQRCRHFCLDSGYLGGQAFWTKRLGDPTVVLKDKYGPGVHHMLWLRPLDM